MSDRFERLARHVSYHAGQPWVFLCAFAAVTAWLVAGPLVGWAPDWHLWASSVTTVITFLMVFVIQATQNKDQAQILAMLREICEDSDEVDERRARERAAQEEKP